MKIRRATKARAYQLISDWLDAPKMQHGLRGCQGKTGAVSRTFVPRGQWLVKEADGSWAAIDNHDGILAVEEFTEEEAAIKWLTERHVDDIIRLRRRKNEKDD